MSVPPQGGWQPGSVPPNQGQPFGQPFDPSAYNPQQQPPPPGWQQGPWGQQPGPPPPKGGGLKWLLIAVAVLLVVAVSIGATLLFTRDGGGGGSTPTQTSGASSDIASANDTGPVSIITEEPTCDAFSSINGSIAAVESGGWSAQRKSLGPASEWTPDQRLQVQTVATAMRNAADQVAPLIKQTPHRVVRELFEQFIAYGRAYADSVPNYSAADNFLADVNVNIGNALLGICNAITYKSASRSLAVGPASSPSGVAPPQEPADPQRFIGSPSSACTTWVQREGQFIAETSNWGTLDTSVSGAQWNPEQRAIQLGALPLISAMAGDMERTGRQSGNPVFEDFAVLAASYFRAYVSTGESYVGADSWLSQPALRINNVVAAACQAAGS